jgi:hypothetical protein
MIQLPSWFLMMFDEEAHRKFEDREVSDMNLARIFNTILGVKNQVWVSPTEVPRLYRVYFKGSAAFELNRRLRDQLEQLGDRTIILTELMDVVFGKDSFAVFELTNTCGATEAIHCEIQDHSRLVIFFGTANRVVFPLPAHWKVPTTV